MKMRIKLSNFLLGILVVFGFAKLSQAATSGGELKSEEPSKKEKKKTTDVSFEDVLVQGKYHFSDEAVTTVEQDKVLDALLSVRKDFRDRIQKSAERH